MLNRFHWSVFPKTNAAATLKICTLEPQTHSWVPEEAREGDNLKSHPKNLLNWARENMAAARKKYCFHKVIEQCKFQKFSWVTTINNKSLGGNTVFLACSSRLLRVKKKKKLNKENKTYILCEKFLFYKILSECFPKEVGPIQQTKEFCSHQDVQLKQLYALLKRSFRHLKIYASFQYKLYTPIRPNSL